MNQTDQTADRRGLRIIGVILGTVFCAAAAMIIPSMANFDPAHAAPAAKRTMTYETCLPEDKAQMRAAASKLGFKELEVEIVEKCLTLKTAFDGKQKLVLTTDSYVLIVDRNPASWTAEVAFVTPVEVEPAAECGNSPLPACGFRELVWAIADSRGAWAQGFGSDMEAMKMAAKMQGVFVAPAPVAGVKKTPAPRRTTAVAAVQRVAANGH